MAAHFTNFAILLDGGGSSSGKCGSSTNDYITGKWWGDLTLTAALIGTCCCFGVVFIVLVLFVPPLRRMFVGEAMFEEQILLSKTQRPTSMVDLDGQL